MRSVRQKVYGLIGPAARAISIVGRSDFAEGIIRHGDGFRSAELICFIVNKVYEDGWLRVDDFETRKSTGLS